MNNFCYIHNQRRTVDGYCVRCNSIRFPSLQTRNEIPQRYRQYDQNGRRVRNTTNSIGNAMINFRNQLNIMPSSRHIYNRRQRPEQNIYGQRPFRRQQLSSQSQTANNNLRVGYWGNLNYPTLTELPERRLTKLDKLLLRNTKTFTSEELEDKECTICFEKLEKNKTIRILKCMHMFHQECIDQWFKTSAERPGCNCVKCPLCNTEYKL